ncbi:MAG TPA: class I SAM-dependent methyltransferase [Solirubrobacteraceae bacterium]|jgi:SAM-dependent methyltransferase
MATTTAAPAPYDVLAPAYDTIVADYDYPRWLDVIETIARRHGFRGRRVLDVACGTGASFMPLLERGHEVVGCDISYAMLERARERAGDRDVELHWADMRALPQLGEFDLVLCLDDAINHLLGVDDVALALDGMARNLTAGGILVFDVNTLSALRAGVTADWTWKDEHRIVRWLGLGPRDLPPDGTGSARVTVLDGGAPPRTTLIRERHHPVARLRSQVEAAGLELVAACGQRQGIRVTETVDEERDDKALLFARRVGAGA